METITRIIFMLLIMAIVFFVCLDFIGCNSLSPWVDANGGAYFMPWCK